MVKRSNLRNMHMMDFFQVMKNINNHLKKEDLETLKLKKAYETDFLPAFTAFSETISPLYKSGLTEKILLLDEDRDKEFKALRSYLKAQKMHPDPQIAEAAERLINIIHSYGKNIERKPLREETSIIKNILEDFSSPQNAAYVALVSAMPRIEKLAAYNDALEEVYNDRNRVEEAIAAGKAKEARENMQKAFSRLVEIINALAYLKGARPYQTLIYNINKEVSQALLTVKLSRKCGDEETTKP
ncbi:MAG TPA: DUF6261 family protein [Dysgonamonadaceae bacterium]|nr:DUF6261 family protein [Dysgonamonadaceae bacterium]